MAITSMADLNRVIHEVNARQEAAKSPGYTSNIQYAEPRTIYFEEVPSWTATSGSPPPLQAAPAPSIPVVQAAPKVSEFYAVTPLLPSGSKVSVDVSDYLSKSNKSS